MPLSINVGLSRKASHDYQSTGTSINIVAELDQSLLAQPEELQKQSDALYQQAQEAVDRNAAAPAASARDTGHDRRPVGNDHNGVRDGGRDNGRHGRDGNVTTEMYQAQAVDESVRQGNG